MITDWWAAILITGDTSNPDTYSQARSQWEEDHPTVTANSPEIKAIADKAKKIKHFLKDCFGIKIASDDSMKLCGQI